MKKVLSFLHTCDKRLGSFFSSTAVGQIIIAIILAAAVACASSIADGIKEEFKERDLYNEISIENSKVYLEDVLGHPRFVYFYPDSGITDARYFTKHAMVRVFYYDESVIGYFITSLDRNYKRIGRTEYVGTEGKPLGSYTYQDVDGYPYKIKAYQSSSALEAYLEQYEFSDDNGNSHYCMYLNKYGFDKNELTSAEEYFNDEEVKNIDADEMDGFDDIFIDRSKSYPNTYGVCAMEHTKDVEGYLLKTIYY